MNCRVDKRLGALLTLFFGSSAVGAQERLSDPFYTANRSPVIGLYGLPPTEAANLARPGALEWAAVLSAANNFTNNDDANEALFFDGETQQFTLRLRHGLSDRWELGLDAPWLRHDSGLFDDVIDDWHDWFNLPEGDRPLYPSDQLRFAYANTAGERLDLTDSADGVGDVKITAAYGLAASNRRQLSARAGVELPTGDAEQLLGSESTDVYAGIHLSDWGLANDGSVTLHSHLGVLVPGGGEVLASMQRDAVGYGSLSLAWAAGEGWQLKMQLDGHSAFYDSELRELGSASAQLVVGGSVQLAQHYTLDIYLSEDIAAETSPDVVFQLALRAAY